MVKGIRFTLVAALLGSAAAAHAGFLVVNNDEWTLSGTGFANSPSAGTFIRNVTNFRRQYLAGFYSGVPHPAL